MANNDKRRFAVLDGVRACSILLVLAAHMLPLGPKALLLNEAAGQAGMSLFFLLSGFLITSQLRVDHSVPAFLLRRLFRIVPLYFVAVLGVAIFVPTVREHLVAYLLFAEVYAGAFASETSHFWSLCVEMHFYLGVALLMWITRFRGFVLLPVVWIGFVILRAYLAPGGTIWTHVRVDEILAGCTLRIAYETRARDVLARLPLLLLVPLWFSTSLPQTEWFQALRSATTLLLIGRLLCGAESMVVRMLSSKPLRYVADVSYALYVVHPFTRAGWLLEGDGVVRAGKRLLSFALTFAVAHLSTFHFELPITEIGRKLARRFAKPVSTEA